MNEPVFYVAGHSEALTFTEAVLKKKDFRFSDCPDSSVTHILLGVPSFEKDGSLKGGGSLEELLLQFPTDVTVCGGLLRHPALGGYRTVDLMEDPTYVAENARITAYCAVRLATQKLPVTLWRCPVLVIGCGRIGKCLAQLLGGMGALVTVAARKESDRAMLAALGYDTVSTADLPNSLARYRVIFNTAPMMLLTQEGLEDCPQDCLKIDLASCPGMDAPDVIWARGLPGKDAPETSGELIARTILRLLYNKERS